MREAECVRHEETRRATTTGQWAPELARHAAGCARCQDTVHVLRSLERFRESAASLGSPPPPHLVFLKYRLRERVLHEQGLVERATRAVLVVECIAAVVALSTLTSLWRGEVGVSPDHLTSGAWSMTAWLLAFLGTGALIALRVLRLEE